MLNSLNTLRDVLDYLAHDAFALAVLLPLLLMLCVTVAVAWHEYLAAKRRAASYIRTFGARKYSRDYHRFR